MGLQTKAIKQKIKSVRNIGKITKTMEMVSVSKMKKATERVTQGRPYSHYALQLLHHIATTDHITHPLLETPVASKILVLVISSNKGLAGSYNTNISKVLTLHARNLHREGISIECITIGKQSEKGARANNLPIIAHFTDFSEKSTSEEFLVIRDLVLEKFKTKEYKAVQILFTEFKGATNYKPFVMNILPVQERIYTDMLMNAIPEENEVTETELSRYIFEPNETYVLDEVIHQLLGQAIFHTFLEALASEHSARMFAMKNANDNAQEMITSLTLDYNQARQGAITQELAEIVGGATAME